MILVTGATGVVGRFVVEELVRRGREVRVLCRTEPPAGIFPHGVEIARGDLGDGESLARAARGVQGIVHSALGSVTDSTMDIGAMRALLEAWRQGPFVFVSTLDVYGLAGPGIITEETPVSETFNDYSRGKVICERLLHEAADRAGRTDWVSLRAPYIWGPHPTARKRLVNRHLRDNRSTAVLPGTSPEEWMQYRSPWVDTRDFALIVAESLVRPAGGPLNVVTGNFVWHQLYEQLIRLTGSAHQIVHKALDAIRDDELPNKHIYAETSLFSEARLEQVLGKIPRLPLEITLRDTVSSILEP